LCSSVLHRPDRSPRILLPPEILLGPDLCSGILHVPGLPVLSHVPDLRFVIRCELRFGILCRLWVGFLYRL
jgi:hypothetical protein